MSKTFITVVGEEQQEFTLHTDVACRSSKFFQAALSKGWKESLQNRVMLREITTIDFQGYLQGSSSNDPSHLEAISMGRTISLYILGHFLDDSTLRVAMLKTFARDAIDNNAFHANAFLSMPSTHTQTYKTTLFAPACQQCY